ncbi:MAG TPA: AAA family ATPase [Acidocella sp.]|nr:AAA family ATPase [Acidocella sp.]
MAKLNAALQWARRGFPVFPLHENTKIPLYDAFYDVATSDAVKVKALWTCPITGLERDYNVGVDTSRLLVVDLDNKEGKRGQASYEAIGGKFDTLTVRTPTGGYHLYYRLAEGEAFANTASTIAPDVDTRGHHGYVLAPGSTIDGGAYELVADAPLAPIPDVVRPRLKAPGGKAERAASAELDTPHAIAAVRAFLTDRMPAFQGQGGDDHTFRTICEVRDRGVSEATALELLLEDWNEQCEPPWPVDELRQKVANAYAYAQRGEGEKSPEAYFGGVQIIAPQIDAALRPARKLRLLSPDDCEAAQSRFYLVKELLSHGDIGALYGQPGAGKSILAPHLGYAVAQGRRLFGKRVRPGRVLYVCAEDEKGMRERVRALRRKHGPAPEFMLVGGLGPLTSPDWRDALMDLVAEQQPALVILDTLAAAFPGIDENSGKDMSAVVHFLRQIADTGAACLVVHHNSKDEGVTARGHSVLQGALDVALLVERKEAKLVAGKLVKNRNGSPDHPLAFRIDVERLGTDEDGDPITAPIASEVDASAMRPGKKLSRSQAAALDDLRDMSSASDTEAPDGSGARAVSETAWRETLRENRRVCASDSERARRSGSDRAVRELLEDGHIEIKGGMVWLKAAAAMPEDQQAKALKDFAGINLPENAATA